MFKFMKFNNLILARAKIKLFFLLIFLNSVFGWADTLKVPDQVESYLAPHKPTGFYIKDDCNQVLINIKYQECYNYYYNTPDFVIYSLDSADILVEKYKRQYLRTDKRIPREYRPSYKEYSYDGFDAGHLPASSSVDINIEAADEVYVINACVPQEENLNRGLWSKLEKYERKLALINKKIYVVTGVLRSDKFIKNKVRVNIPSALWKIFLIIPNSDDPYFECYLISNSRPQSNKIEDYLIELSDLINKIHIDKENFKLVWEHDIKN